MPLILLRCGYMPVDSRGLVDVDETFQMFIAIH